MKREILGTQFIGKLEFSFYQATSENGRKRFIAEAALGDGERVLLDHWNLSVLQKQLCKITPVMEQARQMNQGFAT